MGSLGCLSDLHLGEEEEEEKGDNDGRLCARRRSRRTRGQKPSPGTPQQVLLPCASCRFSQENAIPPPKAGGASSTAGAKRYQGTPGLPRVPLMAPPEVCSVKHTHTRPIHTLAVCAVQGRLD